MNKNKRKIIEAARQLFIEKGYQDTSIMDIISSANVSKGTFYNHFTSKEQCLLSILEETRNEIISKRFEVAMNSSFTQKEILIKQISLFAKVNRERNLVQIFESLSMSGNKELRRQLDKFFVYEIDWLAKRFVDVYGEKIRDISYECAVQAIGMIQQSYRITAIATQKLASPEYVATTVLNYIDAIILKLKEEKKLIVTYEVVSGLKNLIEEAPISKEDIIKELEEFKETLNKNDFERGLEFTNFLLNELKSNSSNFYVFESMITFFNQAFRNTSYEAEANELSVHLLRYFQSIKAEIEKH